MPVRFKSSAKRGETIIEVSIAISIFAMVAALSISMMNSGIATAQAAMETSMTRNEIDAQSEALRYIHDSYASERSLPSGNQKYRELWRTLIKDDHSLPATSLPPLQRDTSCPTTTEMTNWHAYVINTRYLSSLELVSGRVVNNTNAGLTIKNGSTLKPSSLYPRLIFSAGGAGNSDELSETNDYTSVARAEGIWIITSPDSAHTVPEFYDFHIYTCWFAPGRSNPSTIGTIVRLYNPELVGTE